MLHQRSGGRDDGRAVVGDHVVEHALGIVVAHPMVLSGDESTGVVGCDDRDGPFTLERVPGGQGAMADTGDEWSEVSGDRTDETAAASKTLVSSRRGRGEVRSVLERAEYDGAVGSCSPVLLEMLRKQGPRHRGVCRRGGHRVRPQDRRRRAAILPGPEIRSHPSGMHREPTAAELRPVLEARGRLHV